MPNYLQQPSLTQSRDLKSLVENRTTYSHNQFELNHQRFFVSGSLDWLAYLMSLDRALQFANTMPSPSVDDLSI